MIFIGISVKRMLFYQRLILDSVVRRNTDDDRAVAVIAVSRCAGTCSDGDSGAHSGADTYSYAHPETYGDTDTLPCSDSDTHRQAYPVSDADAQAYSFANSHTYPYSDTDSDSRTHCDACADAYADSGTESYRYS